MDLSQNFPHLKPLSDRWDKKALRENVLSDLKHYFPDHKFSVVRPDLDCMGIRWINGPTQKNVESVMKKYEDHESDESLDFWDYSPTEFNRVFGGVKFLFCYRYMSDDVEALEDSLPEWVQEKPQTLRKIFCRTTIQKGAKNFRIVRGKYDFELLFDI